MMHAICHDGKMEGDSVFDPLVILEVDDYVSDLGLTRLGENDTIKWCAKQWLERMVEGAGFSMDDLNATKTKSLDPQLVELKRHAKRIKGVWIINDDTVDFMYAVFDALSPTNSNTRDATNHAVNRALKMIAQHTSIRKLGKVAKSYPR